jgi:hypothetical protein
MTRRQSDKPKTHYGSVSFAALLKGYTSEQPSASPAGPSNLNNLFLEVNDKSDDEDESSSSSSTTSDTDDSDLDYDEDDDDEDDDKFAIYYTQTHYNI